MEERFWKLPIRNVASKILLWKSISELALGCQGWWNRKPVFVSVDSSENITFLLLHSKFGHVMFVWVYAVCAAAQWAWNVLSRFGFSVKSFSANKEETNLLLVKFLLLRSEDQLFQDMFWAGYVQSLLRCYLTTVLLFPLSQRKHVLQNQQITQMDHCCGTS